MGWKGRNTYVSTIEGYRRTDSLGEEFKGYVYEVRNVSTKGTVDLDIRKLQFGSPNQAVLAFSDLDLLDKAGARISAATRCKKSKTGRRMSSSVTITATRYPFQPLKGSSR